MEMVCRCSNCQCDKEESAQEKSPKEKVEEMKKSIEDLGFKVEETEEGIKISE